MARNWRWISSTDLRPCAERKSSRGLSTSTDAGLNSPTAKYRLITFAPTTLGRSGSRSLNWLWLDFVRAPTMARGASTTRHTDKIRTGYATTRSATRAQKPETAVGSDSSSLAIHRGRDDQRGHEKGQKIAPRSTINIAGARVNLDPARSATDKLRRSWARCI